MAAEVIWVGLLFLGVVYLLCVYVFLIPAEFEYLFGPNNWANKSIHIVAYILSPAFIPLGILWWLGWAIFRVAAALMIVLVFSALSVLYVINARFPLAGLFTAWMKASRKILNTEHELLNIWGV